MALNMTAVRLAAENARVALRTASSVSTRTTKLRDQAAERFGGLMSGSVDGTIEEIEAEFTNSLFAGHITFAQVQEVAAAFATNLGDKLAPRITPEAKLDAAVEALLELEDTLHGWTTDPGNCLSARDVEMGLKRLRTNFREAAEEHLETALDEYADELAKYGDGPAIPLNLMLNFVEELLGALGAQPDQQAEIRRTVEIALF